MPVGESLLSEAVFEQLRRATAADPASFTGLYRDFLADAWQSLRQLTAAIAADQPEEIRDKAHYMKSGSMVLGMREISVLATRMEAAAKGGDRTQYATVLAHLKAALEHLQAELVTRLGPEVVPADDATA